MESIGATALRQTTFLSPLPSPPLPSNDVSSLSHFSPFLFSSRKHSAALSLKLQKQLRIGDNNVRATNWAKCSATLSDTSRYTLASYEY
ncbi:hypothetical protein SOVF_028710 [Spinacia oleracea]|nr:hypothetical protein SOVF_028710 [Spinacia oleracea]